VLSLSVHPLLTDRNLDIVAERVNAILAELAPAPPFIVQIA
jgi:hypothetical protein